LFKNHQVGDFIKQKNLLCKYGILSLLVVLFNKADISWLPNPSLSFEQVGVGLGLDLYLGQSYLLMEVCNEHTTCK
jgi:hypothetical protein